MKTIKSVVATCVMLVMAMAASAAEISKRDQAVVEAMMNSDSKGAVIGPPGTCLISYGLFDDTGFIGFFGLFPNEEEADCDNSFTRTNPDGSLDDHIYVHGTLFMFIFGGPILGSEGSKDSGWIVVDAADVVTHVLSRSMRKYHDLDGLWADAEEVSVSAARVKDGS